MAIFGPLRSFSAVQLSCFRKHRPQDARVKPTTIIILVVVAIILAVVLRKRPKG